MKKAFSLLFVLAVLTLALTGCTAHDAMFNDDAAIAGPDRNSALTYIGGSDGPNSYSLSVNSITGAATVWSLRAGEGMEEVTLSYTLTCTEGKTKLALVAPDDTVVTLSTAEKGMEQEGNYAFTPQPGTYRLKVVGAGGAQLDAAFHGNAGSWGG